MPPVLGELNMPALFMLYQELATLAALPSKEPAAEPKGLIAPAVARLVRASFWKFTAWVR